MNEDTHHKQNFCLSQKIYNILFHLKHWFKCVDNKKIKAVSFLFDHSLMWHSLVDNIFVNIAWTPHSAKDWTVNFAYRVLIIW